jgi:phosphoadenosine phosphosulfate reductase
MTGTLATPRRRRPRREEALEALAGRFERAPAEEVVAWAVATFKDRLCLACSFQDVVALDLALTVEPRVEVVFLDTGAHFEETLTFVEEMRQRYQLNLVVLQPAPSAEHPPCGAGGCCEARKVAPLAAHLAGRDAWMSGLRRVEAPTRRHAPVVGFDRRFQVVKVNPLATWSDEQVARYARQRRLPAHPLTASGFTSIGCAPTTSPVARGADARSGRWAGSPKTECGLHL